jgi:hypothetical protein
LGVLSEGDEGGVGDERCEGDEVECGEEVIERRRNVKWSNRECRMLWEVYEESRIEGVKGYRERMLDGWVRRGLRIVKVETLVERVKMVKCGGLAKVEREEITRRVTGGEERGVREIEGGVEVAVEAERVREEEVDFVVSGGGQDRGEVNVRVERVDVWREGDDVRVLDEEMKGVLARLREVLVMEQTVEVPSIKSRN